MLFLSCSFVAQSASEYATGSLRTSFPYSSFQSLVPNKYQSTPFAARRVARVDEAFHCASATTEYAMLGQVQDAMYRRELTMHWYVVVIT